MIKYRLVVACKNKKVVEIRSGLIDDRGKAIIELPKDECIIGGTLEIEWEGEWEQQ